MRVTLLITKNLFQFRLYYLKQEERKLFDPIATLACLQTPLMQKNPCSRSVCRNVHTSVMFLSLLKILQQVCVDESYDSLMGRCSLSLRYFKGKNQRGSLVSVSRCAKTIFSK